MEREGIFSVRDPLKVYMHPLTLRRICRMEIDLSKHWSPFCHPGPVVQSIVSFTNSLMAKVFNLYKT